MHDKAFTFQTLHPDTIIDGLFDLGMRVDSGLTPLNSYENRVYQFQDEERRRYVVKFYRPERWSAEQILEEHQFALQLVQMKFPLLRRCYLTTVRFISIRVLFCRFPKPWWPSV
jgi:Ser/Thr protein kinase RdoA (MazF antagonist)